MGVTHQITDNVRGEKPGFRVVCREEFYSAQPIVLIDPVRFRQELLMHRTTQCCAPARLKVRSQPFHGGNTGSTPLGEEYVVIIRSWFSNANVLQLVRTCHAGDRGFESRRTNWVTTELALGKRRLSRSMIATTSKFGFGDSLSI